MGIVSRSARWRQLRAAVRGDDAPSLAGAVVPEASKSCDSGEDVGLTRRGTTGGRAQEQASIDRSDAAVRVLMAATL